MLQMGKELREVKVHLNQHQEPNMQCRVFTLDEPGSGGAFHSYTVMIPGHGDHQHITFQKGPMTTRDDANGVTLEALMGVCMDRLICFQSGPFNCTENGQALIHLTMALEALHKRTNNRIERGVEGQEKE